jgi:hypothetical protein
MELDPSDPRFHAIAVIEEGELVIDIRTELESGERSAFLHGAYQLRRILAHFFPRYESIGFTWLFGDNWAAFNRATAAGATPEEAAVRTALGHQVALCGFSRVLIRALEGLPARYTKIVVSFTRPCVYQFREVEKVDSSFEPEVDAHALLED